MRRSGRLQRRTPINKKRSKPRRGEPTQEEKEEIRKTTYELSGGICELNLLPTCRKGVLPFKGNVFERWHLVHLHARRRFGWDQSNLAGGCYECHIRGMHEKGLKPTIKRKTQ